MAKRTKRTRKGGTGRTGAHPKRRRLDPSLNVRGAQPYVAIPARATSYERGRVDALLGEVFDWLARRGVAPAGPPFHRYRAIGDAGAPIDVEAGVPVATPLEGEGRITAGVLPGGAYAVAVHEGHPDLLPEAHEALRAWARDAGLRPALRRTEDGREAWGARVESFLTDPAKEARPEAWSIEIAYLLDAGDPLDDDPAGGAEGAGPA